MINISKRKKKVPAKLKSMGDHDEFLNRITKSLYYSKLPKTDCLSLPVTELAAELFTEVKSGTLERLDVEEASRISRNACVSPCSLVLALLYLERLKDCNSEYLQRVAPSELFLVSLMVASKFLHDDGEDDEVFNWEWANSGDLTLRYMNELEKDFLKAINWSVYVRNQDFWDRLQNLEKDIAYKEAQKRGWFSYTELSCLMNSMQLMAIAHTVVNVSSVCLATYAAGIITLLGSALVASQLPGTALGPRRTDVTNNVTRIEFDTVIESNSSVNPTIPNNLITADFINTSLNCNETCQVYKSTQDNDDAMTATWQWWLNSIMTWLPEYSGLESIHDFDIQTVQLEQPTPFISNSKYFFGTTPVVQNVKDNVAEINWKEVLGLDLKFHMHDWRHYASYVTKVTLSH